MRKGSAPHHAPDLLRPRGRALRRTRDCPPSGDVQLRAAWQPRDGQTSLASPGRLPSQRVTATATARGTRPGERGDFLLGVQQRISAQRRVRSRVSDAARRADDAGLVRQREPLRRAPPASGRDAPSRRSTRPSRMTTRPDSPFACELRTTWHRDFSARRQVSLPLGAQHALDTPGPRRCTSPPRGRHRTLVEGQRNSARPTAPACAAELGVPDLLRPRQPATTRGGAWLEDRFRVTRSALTMVPDALRPGRQRHERGGPSPRPGERDRRPRTRRARLRAPPPASTPRVPGCEEAHPSPSYLVDQVRPRLRARAPPQLAGRRAATSASASPRASEAAPRARFDRLITWDAWRPGRRTAGARRHATTIRPRAAVEIPRIDPWSRAHAPVGDGDGPQPYLASTMYVTRRRAAAVGLAVVRWVGTRGGSAHGRSTFSLRLRPAALATSWAASLLAAVRGVGHRSRRLRLS